MSRSVDVATVRRWLFDDAEIAFLDVREAGEFGEGHPFLAIPAPYSRLEMDVPRLVPRRTTRTVLVDGSDGVADRAALALAALGYSDLFVLRGGIPGWRAAGFGLFQGVNLPSKTFGELVEHAFETPRISAGELDRRVRAGERLAILDGRPLEEFRKMSIPGAVCCPNGELALRVGALVPDPATPIVVNCAGRTRSIVGAQTLIDLGVPNPVFALENGTQGWYLQDLPLDHGRSATYPADTDTSELARRRVETLAEAEGVPSVDRATLAEWVADGTRTAFIFDIRSPQESRSDPVDGAVAAPGGQLIQATDQYVGVRNARLVLVDTDGVRAPVAANWLRRLGHESFVADRADLPSLRVREATPAAMLPEVDAATLARERGAPRILDLRSSASFREAHVEGAEWSIRPSLTPADGPVVLVSDEPAVAAIAARDLAIPARRLVGGPDEWARGGLSVASSPDIPADAQRIDFLFFVHDRHDGNKDAARRYLAWETGLIDRLTPDEIQIFRLPDRR